MDDDRNMDEERDIAKDEEMGKAAGEEPVGQDEEFDDAEDLEEIEEANEEMEEK